MFGQYSRFRLHVESLSLASLRAGFAVSLILVQPGRAAAGSGMGRLGVPTYRIWDESDLGSVFGRSQGAQPTSLGQAKGAGLWAKPVSVK